MHFGGQKLGCESILVQAKIGHDLRPFLDDTFSGPLPPLLQTLVDKMMGYVPYRVVENDHAAGRAVVAGSVDRWFSSSRPSSDGALAAILDGEQNDTLAFSSN